MRYCILILLFFIFIPLSAHQMAVAQSVSHEKGVLIRDIRMDGFVLGDRDQFTKIFKPYRNKYLTAEDMDDILQKIQIVYEREGYKELVTITYQVTKHRLVYTALMTS